MRGRPRKILDSCSIRLRLPDIDMADRDAVHAFVVGCFDSVPRTSLRKVVSSWIRILYPRRLKRHGRYPAPGKQGQACHTPGWWPSEVSYHSPTTLAKPELALLGTHIALLHAPHSGMLNVAVRKAGPLSKPIFCAIFAVARRQRRPLKKPRRIMSAQSSCWLHDENDDGDGDGDDGDDDKSGTIVVIPPNHSAPPPQGASDTIDVKPPQDASYESDMDVKLPQHACYDSDLDVKSPRSLATSPPPPPQAASYDSDMDVKPPVQAPPRHLRFHHLLDERISCCKDLNAHYKRIAIHKRDYLAYTTAAAAHYEVLLAMRKALENKAERLRMESSRLLEEMQEEYEQELEEVVGGEWD